MTIVSYGVTTVFVVLLSMLTAKYWNKNHAINVIPSMLTSIGVLGTFVGILVGLLYFNVANIEASIPKLLEGLKIAFFTSVAGISLAMIFKYSHQLKGSTEESDEGLDSLEIITKLLRAIQQQQATDHVVQQKYTAAMVENSRATQVSLTELVTGNQAIHRALAGDEDGSLLTQMQKIRTTLIDKNDEVRDIINEIKTVLRENTDALVEEFRAFSKHMMENASAALIQALEGVIRDFNEKLTEQFGENFKQLNQAVERMVDWLEGYKNQLELIKQHLSMSEQALQTSEDSLGHIRSDFSRVVETSDELKAILHAYGKSKEELQQGMQRFNELAEQSKQSLPLLEEKVKALTENFSNSVQAAIDTSAKAVQQQSSSIGQVIEEQSIFVKTSTEQIKSNSDLVSGASKQLADTTEDMLKEIKQTHDHLSETVRTTSETHGRIISESVQELTETSKQLAANLAKSLEATEKEVGNRIQELFSEVTSRNTNLISQIEESQRQTLSELDAALGKSLTEALENLGNKMATVSQKFVNDYIPLTERLQELVKLADGLKS